MAESFPCYLVEASPQGPRGSLTELTLDALPEGELLVEVECSSLNYKDALACQGHPGVAPNLPHIPGIDCSAQVLQSESEQFQPGDKVLITGRGFGSRQWGGYSARARLPAAWALPMPEGLSAREAMVLGTAGFTAAQCVTAVIEKVAPDAGEILVTGATGGVGSLSVALLAKLGYQVVAVTGKSDQTETLLAMGASRVVGREVLSGPADRPLLKASWAAAIDTVGGDPLTNIVRSIQHRGVVAACGLVAGERLDLTVYPFILRGVTLAGIDSAECPLDARKEIWRRLSGPWKIDLPESFITEITLSELPSQIDRILQGDACGRTLVRPIP